MDSLPAAERPLVYERLLRGFAESAPAARQEERWAWLMAAHVTGQDDIALHFDCHRRMLAFARETSDWREAAGQLLRIVLLPFGHLLRRLPRGNVGRSTVGVLQAMEPPEAVQRLIDWAVLAVRIPTLSRPPA